MISWTLTGGGFWTAVVQVAAIYYGVSAAIHWGVPAVLDVKSIQVRSQGSFAADEESSTRRSLSPHPPPSPPIPTQVQERHAGQVSRECLWALGEFDVGLSERGGQ